MDLNFKTFGQGEPLVMLHGLLGSLDNWQTIGKALAEDYMVYLIDQRNHGRSPHVEEVSYPAMAQDLKQFMEANWIYRAHLFGHSMGGKTVMQFALQYPDMVDRLIVVDIAPRAYSRRHEEIFDALRALNIKELGSRSDAETALQANVKEPDVRQFLLKNLSRTPEGAYAWKINLNALYEQYDHILAAVDSEIPFEGPTLFIRGGRSDYVHDKDRVEIERLFPNARIETVEAAGHWVHVDAPRELMALVREFLTS